MWKFFLGGWCFCFMCQLDEQTLFRGNYSGDKFVWKCCAKRCWTKKTLFGPRGPYTRNWLTTLKEIPERFGLVYGAVSASVFIWVPKLGESRSGQMVSEKVKWALFDVYLSQTLWNLTKNSLKQLKRPISVISHWFSVKMVQKGPKLCKRKLLFLGLEIFSEVFRVCHRKADVQGFLKMWSFLLL